MGGQILSDQGNIEEAGEIKGVLYGSKKQKDGDDKDEQEDMSKGGHGSGSEDSANGEDESPENP